MQFFFIKNILIEIRSDDEYKKNAEYDHFIADGFTINYFKQLKGKIVIKLEENKFYEYLKILLEKTNSKITKVIFILKDTKSISRLLNSEFIIIDGAGGVVLKDNCLLMVYRAGKWDLPRGKLKKNESYPTAAIREIKEECNVSARVIDHICSTCFAYMIKNKIFFKHIYWYILLNIYDEGMKPQLREGITKVAWIPYNKLDAILSNSYLSINSVLDQCFKKLENGRT